MKPEASLDCPFELRFAPLRREGCGYSFPCDAEGQVPLDSLAPRALANYLFARALVGRELLAPTIEPRG
jgi:hypothetical protein